MIEVRQADPGDHPAVARVLEGALLEIPTDIADACSERRVLVAGTPIVGALLLLPAHPKWGGRIAALAVIHSRRGEGIGRALIEAALAQECWNPLSATAPSRVRGFYAALNFAIMSVTDDRIFAVRGSP